MSSLSSFSQRVGFIGAGNMAAALMGGMVQAGLVPEQISATDVDSAKLQEVSTRLGIVSAPDLPALLEACDVVIVAVKPQYVVEVLSPCAHSSTGHAFISVAAGLSTSTLEASLGGEPRVIRAMPNTPALVGEGATGLSRGRFATNEDLDTAAALLGAVGLTEIIPESHMDALTGLSGSGPAYLMLVMEAMADGAVAAGLPRAQALRLAAQTVKGAGSLALESGQHPAQLKDMVTSPAGTTIFGVAALEAGGLRSALMKAVLASAARSKELTGK